MDAHRICAFMEKKDIPEIMEALKNSDFFTQLSALKKVRKSGLSLKEIQTVLEPVRASHDVRIRLLALRILYENGDKGILALLIEYLTDPYEKRNIKLQVLSTINDLQEDTLVEQLLPLIHEEKDVAVKIALLKTVLHKGALKSSRETIVPILEEFLSKGTDYSKRRVLNMLVQCDAEAIPIIANALNSDEEIVYEKAFDSLVTMGGAYVKTVIRPFIQSPHKIKRYNAVYSLCMLGEESLLRLIETDLVDEDESVRLAALDFLIRKAGRGKEKEDLFIPIIKRMEKHDASDEVQLKASSYIKKVNSIQRMLRR